MIKVKEHQMTNSMAYALPGLNQTDVLIFPNRSSSANYVIDLVCKGFGLPFSELCRKTREVEVCAARQICMFLMRRYTNLTLKQVGAQFGRRRFDHTTVVHSNRRAIEILETDERIRNIVRNIEFQLY